ncbi:hypothetical protein A2473_04145 [candidate division WWE3 bacterium RIFOXYC2_FULL_42_13]|uniref:Uncharacterized protein n=1 Tax=candidate division WWE3 bacterium TaxID=2053526 RepID=A0A3D0ZRJ3_UNCKA|nr:MAG: hypothetical protein A2274_03190 [candidate division WWE3 bacterium RIFOXYA12_FULL_43_11]OGC72552.1 MAG: hypothetical protein A2337_00745 [candidate division WWE3 bacterium RIFOXYB2_FULL_43_9]OGC72966.1 MAG: hypothetical protein A2473_04145 [candidate division WWE3 bacterium RIFOXYC2_FULL_42_13]OGC75817.1 MAG: hypothetical protein A2547_00520 [candidate division WWE3 bacterium RIFOXYD2_FULL_43_10]HBY10376.1 hypothetical protein [candidate division WWE3 bacterium]
MTQCAVPETDVRAGIAEIQVQDAFGQETKQERALAAGNARLILCVTTPQLATPVLVVTAAQHRKMAVTGIVLPAG